MSRAADLGDLITNARAGQALAVARLITLVEDGGPEARIIAQELSKFESNSQVIGITGSPGVGKSTSTSALVKALRQNGKSVAVLAVDPSSTFSGGALLGDRIRMQEHTVDEKVFIRSMASRGHLGGLSSAAPQAVRILEAAGFDYVIVETVGVGQSEIDIAAMADTTLVLLAPGMGDDIQAAKAGILEIGDIFVINKADRDGANQTRRELRTIIHQLLKGKVAWLPPILLTIATKEEGIAEVVQAIADHRAYLENSGELSVRRKQRLRMEVQALAVASMSNKLTHILRDVKTKDPYQALDEALGKLRSEEWT